MEPQNIRPAALPPGKPIGEQVDWHCVVDELPEDGEPVEVVLERTHEIRIAHRGHYQSTSAWFDVETHTPIYETIVQWKEHR